MLLLRVLKLLPFKLDGLFLDTKLSFTEIICTSEFLGLLHVGPGIVVFRVDVDIWIESRIFIITALSAIATDDENPE